MEKVTNIPLFFANMEMMPSPNNVGQNNHNLEKAYSEQQNL